MSGRIGLREDGVRGEWTDRDEREDVSEAVDGLRRRVIVGWCRGGRDSRAALRSRLRRALREAEKEAPVAGSGCVGGVGGCVWSVRGSSEAVLRDAEACFVAARMGEAAVGKGGRDEAREEAVAAVGVRRSASETPSEECARRGGLLEAGNALAVGRVVVAVVVVVVVGVRGDREDREDGVDVEVGGRCGVLVPMVTVGVAATVGSVAHCRIEFPKVQHTEIALKFACNSVVCLGFWCAELRRGAEVRDGGRIGLYIAGSGVGGWSPCESSPSAVPQYLSPPVPLAVL